MKISKEKREELRAWFRETGKEIRKLKNEWNDVQRNYQHKLCSNYWYRYDGKWRERLAEVRELREPAVRLWFLKQEFRHKHIAFCQLRGKKREEIERPRENNLPNEERIKEYMREFACTEGETDGPLVDRREYGGF